MFYKYVLRSQKNWGHRCVEVIEKALEDIGVDAVENHAEGFPICGQIAPITLARMWSSK